MFDNIESNKTTPPQEEIPTKTEFRELRPEDFWSGSVEIKKLTPEEFSEKIKEAANEENFTYSGYKIDNPEGEGFEYHFSRYPRRAFGPVAPIEKHQEALKKLAEKVGAAPKEEEKTDKPYFRVLLGLQEGYASYKAEGIKKDIQEKKITDLNEAKEKLKKEIDNLDEFGINLDSISTLDELVDILGKTKFGKDHSADEVESMLGEGFDINKAEIYSVGPWGEYKEPAVVIEGDKSEVEKVYQLAEKFHQARIAVDDLQSGKSHMVETKYCEDPDKE